MEKRKWPWKKRSSERSPGESDSSGSFSSHSGRYSDEQEVPRESPKKSSRSPEITSIESLMDDVAKETVKSLTEKLSAALVNVSAKEDLVKQHAKVAEEAVAGWEKAENEVTLLKQQLEIALQRNVNLEVRAGHLDGALKECVRQIRQLKDDQEKQIDNALLEKKTEYESEKAELKSQILDLKKCSDSIDPHTVLIVESLERENSSLKQELASLYNDLEIITIERDLSTRAAENSSKLQLDNIKKMAKLEAECRRLQSIARKSTPLNSHKSFGVSSFYPESLTDSCKSGSTMGSEHNLSELDQFKNERTSPKNVSVEIDMMDDFLEMERLAASTPCSGFEDTTNNNNNNPMRVELDSMGRRVGELENELKKIETEKLKLQNALDETLDFLNAARSRMAESEMRLVEMENEVKAVNEAKKLVELQLVGMEVEATTLSANVVSLKAEIEEERKLSEELNVKCREMESELNRKIKETELQESINNSNVEPKIKQEDLAVAADKLAECQKTIASLGRQLESLATLEDFLIDTSNIPCFSKISATGGEIWRLPSEKISLVKCDSDRSRMSMEINHDCHANGDGDSLESSLTGGKSPNGFGNFFSRSLSVIELGDIRD